VVGASCCLLNDELVIPEVDDSKRLSKECREEIYQTIVSQHDDFIWAVATRSNRVIDDVGLQQATKECFFETIKTVRRKIQQTKLEATIENFYSTVDGHNGPAQLPSPSKPWKGADEIVYSVALASIIARQQHEQIMLDLAKEYPVYQFDQHGGYPT
jgi:ribonuclease HII